MPDPAVLLLANDPLELRALPGFLHEQLDGIDGGPAVASVELAVHEVCMNCITHAGLSPGAFIEVRAVIGTGTVDVLVSDGGAPYDGVPARSPQPGVAQEGGYGLMIARALAESVEYARVDSRNVWRLSWTSSPAAEGAAQ